MKKFIVIGVWMVCYSLHAVAQSPLDTLTYLKNNRDVYSLIVVKNGKEIYKQYYGQHTDKELFNDQSLTKNIIALLIGIAIEKGYIPSADEKIARYFPELNTDKDTRKKEVTIRQIMDQASGLYHEDLQRPDKFLSESDPSGLVIKSPMVSAPGKEWHYNNAATHLLSVILTKTTGMPTDLFAKHVLFDPLDIRGTAWEKMNDGYIDGSGLLSIRLHTEDLVKIGGVLLNHGRYKEQQVIPEKWVSQLLSPETAYSSYWGFENSGYGLSFYHVVYKDTRVTYGMGWGGQFLVIIPSLQSVIAINENVADKNAVQQSNKFIHTIFPVIFDMLKVGN